MSWALVVPIVLGTMAAGFVQGLSGFAFGLVAMGVWGWTIDPQLAVPMVVWGSVVGQLLGLAALPGRPDFRRALPFVVGGVLGVPIGAVMLPLVNVSLFRDGVGVLLVSYCSVMLLMQRYKVTVSAGGRLLDAVAGFAGGVMGGIAGLTGPVPTMWCSLRGWDKDSQRSVFQAFNLVMQSLTLAVFVLNGTVTVGMLPVLGLMLPVAVIPTLAGARLYRQISPGGFRTLVLGLLLVSGVMLLISTNLPSSRP